MSQRGLADFTSEELAEELARRARGRQSEKPKRWRGCDECSHFIAWSGIGFDPPENYNPCELNHAMSFKMPDNVSDYDWGFYRRVCSDREKLAA